GHLILLPPLGQRGPAALERPLQGQADAAIVEDQHIVSLAGQPVGKTQIELLLDARCRADEHRQSGRAAMCGKKVALQTYAVRAGDLDALAAELGAIGGKRGGGGHGWSVGEERWEGGCGTSSCWTCWSQRATVCSSASVKPAVSWALMSA